MSNGNEVSQDEKTEAILKLMGELAKGEQAAQEKGWVALSDVEKFLGVIYD